MKDYSKANRGQYLEELLRFANDRYQTMKVACIGKVPTEFIPLRDRKGKVYGVKVERKSTVDFIGRYYAYPIAMEAKNTNDTNIRFDAVQPHQADYLDDFTRQPGTLGFVIVSFNMKRFFRVPWIFWGAAYDLRVRKKDTKTPLTITFNNETWTVPKKNSLNVNDFLPQWEIPRNHNTYGIHYLKDAEEYITPIIPPQMSSGEVQHGKL